MAPLPQIGIADRADDFEQPLAFVKHRIGFDQVSEPALILGEPSRMQQVRKIGQLFGSFAPHGISPFIERITRRDAKRIVQHAELAHKHLLDRGGTLPGQTIIDPPRPLGGGCGPGG